MDNPQPPGISLRAILIGLGFSLAISVDEPCGVLVRHGSPMAADFTTGAALFLINDPQPARVWHLLFARIGAVLLLLLMYAKSRFVGFPIHPVGLTLGLIWRIYNVRFSVFASWIAKAVIPKYGGARRHLCLRPFYLGLVLGGFVSAGLWLIIDGFTGMSGNRFTLG